MLEEHEAKTIEQGVKKGAIVARGDEREEGRSPGPP